MAMEVTNENKISLYACLVDQLQKYNSIIWQAPTALLAANAFAIDKWSTNPVFLLAVAIFNGALIFAFHKMVRQQQVIIEATRSAEKELKKSFPEFIPVFVESIIRAPSVMVLTLAVLDVALLVYSFKWM